MRQRHKIDEKNSKYRILVVDDEVGVIDSLTVVLGRSGYQIQGTVDPIEAVDILREEQFDLLILDYLMSPIHGDEVVRRIREFNKELYILLLTGHKDLAPPIETIRSLDIQGYCEKSDRFDQLILLVESGLKSVEQMETVKELNNEIKKTYNLLEDRYMDTVETLRLLVDAKDVYTRGHSDRVSCLACNIGVSKGLTDKDIEILRVGGLFHDVGKVGIPDDILLKTSKLNDEEYKVVKKHPEKGIQILSGMTIFKDMLPLIVQHHERIDGTGYPKSLRGDEIHPLAKIITVADAFDAMQSDRTYRSKFTMEDTIEQLVRGKGSQFDGEIVDIFIELVKKDPDVCKNLVYPIEP